MIANDHIRMREECLEKAHASPAAQMQRNRAFGSIEVKVNEAALGIRVIMSKGGLVTGDIPGYGLDFDDLCPELRQQLAAKGATDPLGEFKDADTGERQVDHAHSWRIMSVGQGICRDTRDYRRRVPVPELCVGSLRNEADTADTRDRAPSLRRSASTVVDHSVVESDA
jgi:hypothetical protein